MIFRFLIKTVTTVAVGSMLVGWASLGGSPAARTIRAAAFGATPCSGSCKHSLAGPAAVSQPAPHKAKPVALKTKAKRESGRHPSQQFGGAP